MATETTERIRVRRAAMIARFWLRICLKGVRIATLTSIVSMVAVAMALALAGAADVRALERIPTDAFSSGASFDTGGYAADLDANECRQTAEAWCDGYPCDTWRVTADALFLQRRNPDAAALVVDALGGAQLLNAGDFDFGLQAGFDISLTRRLGECLGIEARYFGVDHWHAGAAAATAPDSLLQINASPAVSVWAGTGLDAHYSSELQNVELNAQYRIRERWTLLGGFRYAELDERFTADLVEPDIPFRYETAARNRLYGGQLGVSVTLWDSGGPLTIDAVGKAGIFGNAAAQDSAYDTGVVTVPAHDSASRTAFLGEIGLMADYRLTSRWSLRGGYRLLWIDGVALATEQVAASDFVLNRGMNTSGDAFYQGAFVGVQYVR